MNLVVPIIFIVASIGIFFGYINPTYTAATGETDTTKKSITELQSEEKDYRDALGKTREIEVVRDGLLTKFNGIKAADKERVGKLIPDHIDSVRLLIDINNIAARYGMSLSNITLTAPGVLPTGAKGAQMQATADTSAIGPDDRAYDSVKLGFAVSGSYENFLQFLREVEESLRIVDVVSLSFSAKAPAGGTGQNASQAASGIYTYTLVVRTYYLK